MGAWIEIISIEMCVNSDSDVAPFMGAWIEMQESENKTLGLFRRTLYGCVD